MLLLLAKSKRMKIIGLKMMAAPNNSFNRSGNSLDFIDNLDAIRRHFPPR
jgi:hypothetical protein